LSGCAIDLDVTGELRAGRWRQLGSACRRLDELDFGPKRGVEFVRTLTFAEIFERSIRPLSVGIAARDSLFAGNDDD